MQTTTYTQNTCYTNANRMYRYVDILYMYVHTSYKTVYRLLCRVQWMSKYMWPWLDSPQRLLLQSLHWGGECWVLTLSLTLVKYQCWHWDISSKSVSSKRRFIQKTVWDISSKWLFRWAGRKLVMSVEAITRLTWPLSHPQQRTHLPSIWGEIKQPGLEATTRTSVETNSNFHPNKNTNIIRTTVLDEYEYK